MGIIFIPNGQPGLGTPIYTPDRREPAKCPSCGKIESIKEVCRHCEYEYPEESGGNGCLQALGMITVICIGFWFVISVFDWAMGGRHFDDTTTTLLQYFGNQWDWIKEHLKRLW